MERILFICRFSITYADQYPTSVNPEVLQKQLSHFLDLWKPDWWYNHGMRQADGLYELSDIYYVDEFYYYRYILPPNIPHVAKLCEAVASLLAIHHGFEIRVNYPQSLPSLCPPPFEE